MDLSWAMVSQQPPPGQSPSPAACSQWSARVHGKRGLDDPVKCEGADEPVTKAAHALSQITPRLELGIHEHLHIDLRQPTGDQTPQMLCEFLVLAKGTLSPLMHKQSALAFPFKILPLFKRRKPAKIGSCTLNPWMKHKIRVFFMRYRRACTVVIW
jgi:hypothetical protein